MEKYKTLKFENDGKSIDIYMMDDDQSVWLSFENIVTLFDRSKPTIRKYINALFKGELGKKSGQLGKILTPTRKKLERVIDEGNRVIKRDIFIYNLDTIMGISDFLSSKKYDEIQEFINSYYFEKDSISNNNIIIYNNGNISIDVNVSPEEETVWLNQRQIAELFGITVGNASKHIKNILEEGELENTTTEESSYIGSVIEKNSNTDRCSKKNLHVLPSVSKEILHTEIYQKEIRHIASDGKEYSVTFYNLDMILAIEYRVKSNRAIQFRRWASEVLKKYMMTGYVVDKDRAVVTANNFLRLENDVEVLKKQVGGLLEKEIKEEMKQKLFFDGDYFDPYLFLCNLVSSAQEEVVIIDPYFDVSGLYILEKSLPDVKRLIFKSSFSKLSDNDVDKFQKQYGDLEVFTNDVIHDRFIIIDQSACFSLGASLNHMGKRTFCIIPLNDSDIIELLLKKAKGEL